MTRHFARFSVFVALVCLLSIVPAMVKAQGVLVPLIITPRDGQYMLVAGERRLRAAKAAELVEAIRKASKGEATLHPRVASRLIKQFSRGEPDRSTPFTELTEREVEVLTLIARGFTNQKIADELVISIGRVKGHVSNILSKLHLADRTQAAVYAWQEGIVRRE